MKIIFNKPLYSQLLEEGRKENAQAMIVKKVEAPELREYLVDTILNNIIVADPTSNKKYIEWAARRMADAARRQEVDSEADMDTYFAMVDRAKSVIDGRALLITINLKKYHKFAERNLMDKNIDKYKDLNDWEHEIYKAEREEREREEMKRREAGAKETTDYLHDDDNYMIVRPRSEDSSCYYGKGTRWCISATRSRNYFDQYTGEGTGFYFVLFKHLSQDDPYKKLALVFTAGSQEPSEVFDVVDDEVGVDAITDAVRFNIFGEALKKSKTGQQIKKLKGPGRVESYKQSLRDVIEEYDDFMRTDSIEDKPSLQEIFLGLGLDEDDLTDDNADLILEHLEELVNDQQYDIIGEATAHFEDNPAGPTDADFQALYDQHKYDYLYVSYDEYDESRYYWDAGFSLDVSDIHEDLEDQDLGEVEDVLRKILDDYNTYPDDFDGYGSEISIRFQPDYDEQEGLNGFENFLNRMDDVDEALHKIMESEKEETIQTFVEAGLIAGVGMTSLKQRFDNLELDNFDIDIEDRELSIYRVMDITVPIPEYLYKGLTDDMPSWQTANRGEISKSPALQAFDAMIKQRQTEHSDELIEQIKSVFDRVFKLYVQKMNSALPGFERPIKTQQEYGLLIPEYNVGIYRKSGTPQVGASGLMLGYFFDVRIEADEEESLEEENLKLIEMFLRKIDSEAMAKKIRDRFETIVQNDVIKNIIPQFKEGGDAPEMDPRTGKVTSAPERAAASLSNLRESKSKLRIVIKENLPFGGYYPSRAGNLGPNLPVTAPLAGGLKDKTGQGKDSKVSAKIVLHRNGKVLLVKNDRGWDLPGGHIKEDESILEGLMREVFEETGLTLSSQDIKSLNLRHKNKRFFSGEFLTDDIQLSDEHYEHGFYDMDKIQDMKELAPIFKQAILKCANINNNLSLQKLKITIGK